MKQLASIVIVISIVAPLSADAAWWNPKTWKKNQATSTEALATTTLPSVDELYKRIAELEMKLDEAREKIRESEKKAQTVAVKEEAPVEKKVAAAGLSEKEVSAKVKPAIVLVETATTSSSGVVVSAQGDIIMQARPLLIESGGTVTGIASEATVTLSSGSKRTAKLVGFDEAADLAVLRIRGDGPFPYVRIVHDAGVKTGDHVYIFGVPGTKGGSGGTGFVSGVVTRRLGTGFETSTDDKPLDNGGALVNAKGEFVGIPHPSSCKVLEEMKNCLKYTITVNIVKAQLSKVQEGMKLFKEKKTRTADEDFIRGQLSGVYTNTESSPALEYAISSVTGQNSFDFFNTKLNQDEDGKITKIYLNKLKLAADRMNKAADFLKEQSDALNISLINESRAQESLDGYQKKVIQKIQADNVAKLKEYKEKVDFWTKKKNEYDGYMTRTQDVTHDYLMAEGVFVENAAKYFSAERKKILETYSGETVKIF